MTRQSPAPLATMNLPLTARSIREWVRLADEGLVDINPEYQRGSVWNLDQRIGLIESWLRGLPIPAMIVNDRMTSAWTAANGRYQDGTPLYAVIDGQQRLRTAIAWFAGEFAVPASWFADEDLESTEDTDDGPYVRFTGLAKPMQMHFAIMLAKVPMAEAKVATVEEEAAIYLLVNGAGTPQTDEDMANAARVAAGPLRREALRGLTEASKGAPGGYR